MKIINANVEFITPINGAVILQRLEQCGRGFIEGSIKSVQVEDI